MAAKRVEKNMQYHKPINLVLSQTIPDALPHSLLEFLRIIPPQPRSFHIGGTLVVGTRQHRNNRQKDSLWRLHG